MLTTCMKRPESLARVAAAFEDPAVDAVYGDLVYVRNDDPSQVVRYWRAGQFVPGCLERGWMPPHPTFYVRRSVYERLGLFETKFRIAADYESILRILGRGGAKPAYLPHVLVRMRLGGVSNRSLRSMLLKSREDYAAMQAQRHWRRQCIGAQESVKVAAVFETGTGCVMSYPHPPITH